MARLKAVRFPESIPEINSSAEGCCLRLFLIWLIAEALVISGDEIPAFSFKLPACLFELDKTHFLEW
jgi:hypothetical protein